MVANPNSPEPGRPSQPNRPNRPDRHDRYAQPRQTRREMIDETSRFLSWALRHGADVPRIPSRRVKDGGFATLLRQPGPRAMVGRFWDRALGSVLDQWWT